MPTNALQTVSTVINGINITSQTNRIEEVSERISLDIPAGIAGTLSTRTTAAAGVLTVLTGHGFVNNNIFSVFFPGGITRNCLVTATTATSITFTSGVGADLPLVLADIIASRQLSNVVLLTPATLRVMAIGSPQRSMVDFRSAVPATIIVYDVLAGEGRNWVSGLDIANPFGAAVATLHVANGSILPTTVEIGLLKSGD